MCYDTLRRQLRVEGKLEIDNANQELKLCKTSQYAVILSAAAKGGGVEGSSYFVFLGR